MGSKNKKERRKEGYFLRNNKLEEIPN